MKVIFGSKKKWWILGGLSLVVLGVGVFFIRRQQSGLDGEFVQVSRGAIESTVDVPGEIDASIQARLSFLGAGRVVALPVYEGMSVLRGAQIARIDARDLQKSLESSLQDYLTTRSQFDQGIDDRRDTSFIESVRRDADQSQYALNKSVLAVELKDIALNNAILTTPIDGVVVSVPVDTAGVTVSATDVFEIVDPTSLVFSAEVDEIDIAAIGVGTPVRIVLDAYPDATLSGQIDWVGLRAQVSSQSSGGTIFPVKVRIPAEDIFRYRLGMNGTMTIVLEKKDGVLTIPIEATTVRDGKNYVQIQDPKNTNKTIEQEITIGIESEDAVEVLSGVKEGDAVLLAR